VYASAIMLVVWPGVLHARTQILGAGDDARYYTWLGWKMGRLIAHGRVVPFHVGDVIRPFGLDLRLLDGYLPSYVSGLFNLVAGPVLAFNLAVVAGAILNLLAARALARRLTTSRLVCTIAAVAFLTAPPIALNVQLGLLPLFWAFTVPLLVADALDVVSGARAVRPIRLAALLAVAYLCSVYFLVFGGLAYGLIVGIAALRKRDWRLVTTTAAGVLIAVVVLLPFIVPRIQFDHNESARGVDTELLSDSNFFSADAVSVVAQPTRSTFLLPRPTFVEQSIVRLPDVRYAIEATIFPGFLLLAGTVLFVVKPERRRLPLLVAVGALFLFGLGPSLKVAGNFVWKHGGSPVSWLPYRLGLAIPGLGALRAPVRVEYVLVALLVAATAIALQRLVTAAPSRAWIVGAGAGVLVATNLLAPLPTTTFGTTPSSKHALREIARLAHRDDTLVSVPFDCDPAFVSLQVFHHAPVVGCAGSFAANPWSKLRAYTDSAALTKLRCDRGGYGRLTTSGAPPAPFGPADVAALGREFGARFVVIDHAKLGVGCAGVEGALPALRDHRLLGRDARYEVIDLAQPAGG
jgi:MFS family permease